MKQALMDLISSQSPSLDTKVIESSQLVFEQRVSLSCFHCERYGVNWTCPPKIPSLDYRRLFSEYDDALLVYCRSPFNKRNMSVVRRDSTNLVHRALLVAEKFLWDNDHPLAVGFIGGSCKLCNQGCAGDRCRQPTLARIPLEATGVNVVKTTQKVGVVITFPPKNYFYRVGLLFW